MSKVINIGGRLHSTEQGNILTGANEILDDTKGKKQNVINSETDAELLRLENEKQNVLTFDNTPTEGSNNPVKSGGVYAADKALSDAIEAILLLIPSAASALNQLADKAFVNSSVSTATATFRGTYNVVTDLELAYDATHEQIAAKLGQIIATADNNDYSFVQIPVSATSTNIRRTERYKFNGTAWGFEYDLNTSGFTAAQWEAINSGITTLLVLKLSELPTATELATALAGKQATLTFDSEPTALSTNPVTSGGIYTAVHAVAMALTNYENSINALIPSEATDLNQLADKAYVLTKILDDTPTFKGQFVTLAELQAVASPKAGDLGIVRTKDNDGLDVFTFYQYLNNTWNVFFTLQHHPQTKPATTGTTGDYPYNGMGRVELAMNIVNGVNTLTQAMLTQQNTIYVIQYDFTLGEDITVPANCVLEFDGGTISENYNLSFDSTLLIGCPSIYSHCSGVIANEEIQVDWFINSNNIVPFFNILKSGGITGFSIINFTAGKTYVTTANALTYNDAIVQNNVRFIGNGCTITTDNNTYDLGSILFFQGCSYITVEGFKIIDTIPLETKETWGARHGICLMGGHDFIVKNVYLEEIYTDPVYLNGIYNVVIDNVIAHRFGRNGVSLANNQNVLIQHSKFDGNIVSTVAPSGDAHCSVDIESDTNGSFRNVRLFDNLFDGGYIMVNLSAQLTDMLGTSIVIEDNIIQNGDFGFVVDTASSHFTSATDGFIVFRNNTVKETNRAACQIKTNPNTEIQIIIDNCLFYNICKLGVESSADVNQSAIYSPSTTDYKCDKLFVSNITIKQTPNYATGVKAVFFANHGIDVRLENFIFIGLDTHTGGTYGDRGLGYRGFNVLKNVFVQTNISNFYRVSLSDYYVNNAPNISIDNIDGFVPAVSCVICCPNKAKLTNLLHSSIVGSTYYYHGEAYERADIIEATKILIDIVTLEDGTKKYYIDIKGGTITRNGSVLFSN